MAMPTKTYVRLAMRDKSADDNYLLDDVAFSDDEIDYAREAIVDLWNETPPPVTADYTVSSWPWRHYGFIGVKAKLFAIAASNMEANHLAYSAGGVTVDDKNKASEYEQLSAKYMQEFIRWMRHKKREINISLAYTGSIGR